MEEGGPPTDIEAPSPEPPDNELDEGSLPASSGPGPGTSGSTKAGALTLGALVRFVGRTSKDTFHGTPLALAIASLSKPKAPFLMVRAWCTPLASATMLRLPRVDLPKKMHLFQLTPLALEMGKY